MELVSIIVPVYNAEKYINKCIDSILCQTHSNIELIIIDDGSSDETGRICLDYSYRDKRIRYERKNNTGVSSSRNKGIEIAVGKYIVFIDADDFIKVDFIEVLVKNKQVDFVMCGYEIYDYMKRCVDLKYSCKNFYGRMSEFVREIEFYLNPPFLLSPWGKLFSRDIINISGLKFQEGLSYGEDAVFVFEYLMHCDTVLVLDYIGYFYCRHNEITLSKKFLYNKIDINYYINFKISTLLEYNNYKDEKNILSTRLLNSFVSYTKELVKSKLSVYDKYVLFYEKFMLYQSFFPSSKRLSHIIVITAGKYRAFYPLIYLFKFR